MMSLLASCPYEWLYWQITEREIGAKCEVWLTVATPKTDQERMGQATICFQRADSPSEAVFKTLRAAALTDVPRAGLAEWKANSDNVVERVKNSRGFVSGI